MEENGKKRNRKSKLVPRDCMDSDDENIADMQNEIETFLVQIKNKNILKKLSKPPEPKPLQFSVKVEVEELNEQRDSEKNLNIKIDSVQSLSETTAQPVPSTSHSEVPSIRISDEILRMEFENLSRLTTSQADKKIELNVRNLLGKKRKTFPWNHVDEQLQYLLRRKWTNWRNTFPHIRESPLLYKCDKCNKAWWHLHDFREHLLTKHRVHKKLAIHFQTSCHECHLIAYHGHRPDSGEEKYRIKSNCWRCGKDIESHLVSVCEKSARYRCVGCLEKFYTCTLMFDHESVCPLYKQYKLQTAIVNEIYACTQCPAKLGSDADLLDHMRLRHSVRSDLPTDWVLKLCNDCSNPYHLQVWHDCPFKPMLSSCPYCSQKFTTPNLSMLHTNLTKQDYPCKECGVILKRQCMELQHMMEHSKNYIFAYKCLQCMDPLYFPNLYMINKHKFTAHRGQNDSKNLIYEMVVLPKRLAAILPGFEEEKEQKEVTSPNKNSPGKCFDSAYDGLLGFLSDPPANNSAGLTEKLQRKVKKEMKRQKSEKLDCPPKKTKHQHEEAIVDITLPDSSQDEEGDVEIINDPQDNVIIDISSQEDDEIDMQTSGDQQENDIIDIRSPDNLQPNEENNIIEDNSQNQLLIDHTPRNDSDDVHMPKQLQNSENTKEISIGNINDVPLTEINQFDPYLVIKEETIDYNDTIDYTLQETEGMGEIKIENVMKIKEEALNVVQEEDDTISISKNKDTNNISINKTLIAQTVNSQLQTNADNDGLANNIQELKAIKNETLRVKIDEKGILIIQKEDDVISVNNNTDTNNISINKTLIAQTINSQLQTNADNDGLANNIQELKAIKNETLRVKIDEKGVLIKCKKRKKRDCTMRVTEDNDKLKNNIVVNKSSSNINDNDKLKTTIVTSKNVENDDDKLKTNKETLRNDEKDDDKLKTNKETLRNDENNDDKLKTSNDKLRANISVLSNEKLEDSDENNKTHQLDIQIKQEVDDQYFYDNFEVDEEIINFKIKEENLDELIEHDMIILDPNHSVNMHEYEMGGSATTSMTSSDVDPRSLEPEVIVCHSYGKKLYRCVKCNFRGHHHEYKRHVQEEGHFSSKRKHACLRRAKTARLPHTTDTGPGYACSNCSVEYPSLYKYIKHLSKVHNYQMRACPKCFRIFPTMLSLQGHVHAHIKESFVNVYLIKNKEEDDDTARITHQCKTCSKKVTLVDFFSHWESHLDILDITANSQANKTFSPSVEHKHDLKKMLLLIQGIHPPPESQDEAQYTKLKFCLKCKRRFERRNECKRHYIEHLLSDAYQERERCGFLRCQICSADFFTTERYKRHMREHASLPLYKCELCDKAFSDSSNFTKHKKVHNLSVLICDICKKKFTGKPFLEKHILLHQKIKPIECQECKKVFYTESSYRKHISRGRTQFRCNFCHIFFASLRNKWDHMWEIHKERKFIADCPLCKKSFRKHQDVRNHIRIDHRDREFKYVPIKALPVSAGVRRSNVKTDGEELVVVQTE